MNTYNSHQRRGSLHSLKPISISLSGVRKDSGKQVRGLSRTACHNCSSTDPALDLYLRQRPRQKQQPHKTKQKVRKKHLRVWETWVKQFHLSRSNYMVRYMYGLIHLPQESNFVQAASVSHERLQAPAWIFKTWRHPSEQKWSQVRFSTIWRCSVGHCIRCVCISFSSSISPRRKLPLIREFLFRRRSFLLNCFVVVLRFRGVNKKHVVWWIWYSYQLLRWIWFPIHF